MNNINSSEISGANKKLRISKPTIIIGIVLLLLVFALVFLILNQGKNQPAVNNQTEKTGESAATGTDNGVFNPKTDFIETVDNVDQAVVEVKGGSLVTPDNKVVNDKGQVVQNNALPMTPEAPKLSPPLAKEDITAASIKLKADANGFSPSEFTVNANQPVTLVLTSTGVGSRLVFNDPALVALELPVPSNYTMAKTFNAPGTPGEYTFYQDMPGRSKQIGKMIVK
jgi:plastocyanin